MFSTEQVRNILVTPKASAVLKTDPTLCRDRILWAMTKNSLPRFDATLLFKIKNENVNYSQRAVADKHKTRLRPA